MGKAEKSTAMFEYNESSIKSLDWREHIRLRPGMYIGKLGDGSSKDDGIYVLVKEVVDNCIDEHILPANLQTHAQRSCGITRCGVTKGTIRNGHIATSTQVRTEEWIARGINIVDKDAVIRSDL